MKKFLCLISVLTFMFAAISCSSDAADISSNATSAIEYNELVPQYAGRGEIYGAQFALAANVDEVVTFYNGPDESSDVSSAVQTPSAPVRDDEIAYDLTIHGLDNDDKIIKMYSDDTRYFYYNRSKESGIAFLAYFGDAYNYMIGHTSYDSVKSTINSDPAIERTAMDEEQFFTVQPLENTRMLSYKFGDYVLTFFFNNDNLFATTIYNLKVWTENDFLS